MPTRRQFILSSLAAAFGAPHLLAAPAPCPDPPKGKDDVVVVERTAQSSAEISLATAQQQSASEQVVETMREIADVARQTAAGSRQMAESAQMLTAIAERLHGIVYEHPRDNPARPAMDEIDERMYSLARNGK